MIRISNEKHPNIYLVTAKTSKELAHIFLRFQEYYESPEFKNKIFTLKQFKKWYKNIYGKFSYYNDWAGFNIPDYALNPFIDKQFKRLTKEEKKLIRYFKHKQRPFYIIGSPDNDIHTLIHELAHAFYYLNEHYRNKCVSLFNSLDTSTSDLMTTTLLEMGYSESVLCDEIQAYLLEDSTYFEKVSLTKEQKDIIEELKLFLNDTRF